VSCDAATTSRYHDRSGRDETGDSDHEPKPPGARYRLDDQQNTKTSHRLILPRATYSRVGRRGRDFADHRIEGTAKPRGKVHVHPLRVMRPGNGRETISVWPT